MRWFFKTIGLLLLIIILFAILAIMGINVGNLLAISIAVTIITVIIGASVYLGFIFYFIGSIFNRFKKH